jgi:hypothetical protein
MEFLIDYSGLIASSFASFFIVLSASLATYNKSKYPISWTGTLKLWSSFFNSGALLSGIFQFIFIFKLSSIYSYNLGSFIYAAGSISCIFIGIFTYKKYQKLHNLSAAGFFLLNSIGGFIFSLYLINTHPFLGILTAIFAALELIFLLSIFEVLRQIAFAEFLSILFSVLWAVSFYLTK